MGSGRWDADSWKSYASRSTARTASYMSAGGKIDPSTGKIDPASASASSIFTASTLDPALDPSKFKLRESRDSDLNPQSTPIIAGLDVTGSMGSCAVQIATSGLHTLFESILLRKPITDPHLMFMGIGDVAAGDRAPLQVSQFEADIRIDDQLAKLFIEHGGGGNNFESYHLPWYFAAMRTSCDSWEKRQKKGYLFTIGDEEVPDKLRPSDLAKVFGSPESETDLSAEDLLTMAQRSWEVFHIMVEEGSHMRSHRDRVTGSWGKILGQRAIPLSDVTKLSEVIVSAIEINEGRDAAAVASSWSGDTSLVVAAATKGLVPGAGGSPDAVTRF